ncbi:hypothetical protein HY251_02180 [bacterium]|nr:hypothetical protein [bacterium]
MLSSRPRASCPVQGALASVSEELAGLSLAGPRDDPAASHVLREPEDDLRLERLLTELQLSRIGDLRAGELLPADVFFSSESLAGKTPRRDAHLAPFAAVVEPDLTDGSEKAETLVSLTSHLLRDATDNALDATDNALDATDNALDATDHALVHTAIVIVVGLDASVRTAIVIVIDLDASVSDLDASVHTAIVIVVGLDASVHTAIVIVVGLDASVSGVIVSIVGVNARESDAKRSPTGDVACETGASRPLSGRSEQGASRDRLGTGSPDSGTALRVAVAIAVAFEIWLAAILEHTNRRVVSRTGRTTRGSVETTARTEGAAAMHGDERARDTAVFAAPPGLVGLAGREAPVRALIREPLSHLGTVPGILFGPA